MPPVQYVWRCRCGAQPSLIERSQARAEARLRDHQMDFACPTTFRSVPDFVWRVGEPMRALHLREPLRRRPAETARLVEPA